MRAFRRLAVVCTGALLLAAAGAEATPIVIVPGAGLAGNLPALGAWNRAANQWSTILTDPTTVTVSADMFNFGNPSIIGSTNAVFLGTGYNVIRNQMVADAVGEPDDTIVGSLPTAAQFSALMPAGFSLTGTMIATKANLKALGFLGLDGAFGASDGQINFNSGFAFDYDNSDGVGAGLIDFETVAVHEIGHLLGFVSIVDTIDFFMSQAQPQPVPVMPLDLFRFQTANLPATPAAFTTTARSLQPGVAASFGDVTDTWRFSTGVFNGDGRQASHWKDDVITGIFVGVMDPTLAAGLIEPIMPSDLRALDVIGWDIQSVPEPAALFLLGIGVAVRTWRKRT